MSSGVDESISTAILAEMFFRFSIFDSIFVVVVELSFSRSVSFVASSFFRLSRVSSGDNSRYGFVGVGFASG